MNVIGTYINQPVFKSIREDRNTTVQLKQDNDYSLTEPNQRRINKAIENLAQQRGEENIKFLLDIGENLTYQTNIQNGKTAKNDWKLKLKNAALSSLNQSDPGLKERYEPEIRKVFDTKKELTDDEKAILAHKDSIMANADLEALKSNPNENIRNLERNMDYFITSTETPVKQKKYVMERLDYFMSPDYEINPQLKDKKTQVLAEMMNDLAINTPESKIPNIKAINQKSHGMCAAVSIVRKAAAYEDKPNYVDSLLSELDSSDNVMVYDRQHLGSGKRVPVKKTYIDFDYAQEKGYRIIDASTLQWMNIAGMYGVKNEGLQVFSAFDKENFDANHDSFFLKEIPDKTLQAKQKYYQALTKAKEELGAVKSSKIKKDISENRHRLNYGKNMETAAKYNAALRQKVRSSVPKLSGDELNHTVSELLELYKPTSESINKNPENLREYSFIPNEEKTQKVLKVKRYLSCSHSVDKSALDKNAEDITDYIEEINDISNHMKPASSLAQKVGAARRLYTAEAAYRASVSAGLDAIDCLTDNLTAYNIPDRETRISEGFAKVMDRIENNNDKRLTEHFAECFDIKPDNKEIIIGGLNRIKSGVDYMTTTGIDTLYSLMGYGSRRQVLENEISLIKDSIKSNDKEELERSAACLGSKKDKNTILKEYDKMEKSLNENPNDETVYKNVLNRLGYKNQTRMIVDVFNNLAEVITDKNNPEYKSRTDAFKQSAGLPADASYDEILNAANKIGARINAVSSAVEASATLLEVPGEDGTPYFTVSGKTIIMKRMEKDGRLAPAKDMKRLQDRFTKIDKLRSQDEFSSRQGKISDPSLYKFSNEETNALKLINGKINSMYSDVVRNLNNQYREIKEPLAKHANYIGTNEGKYWVQREGESGLYGDQQIKIFEQLTDRPYYESEDIDHAAEIIKNGVHSGISSSSVFHDKPGGHAQYIADITENENNGKAILFHDNTWGSSEHENVWTDSEGLLRTDYSDNRGGELGYITDENWRNGNYIENLTHKKGHVTGEKVNSKVYNRINPTSGGSYDFSLMSGIILQGENPAYKNIAGAIKDAIYIPDSIFVDKIQEYAGKMTKKEIQKAIFRNNGAGLAYKNKYDKIMTRINTNPFNKGIDTKEDYERLSDNDPIRMAFEKTALRQAYPDAPMYNELAAAKDMKDLEKIRAAQRNIAVENFNYAFAKSPDTLLYPAFEHGAELTGTLTKALNDNGLKVSQETVGNIMANICTYDDDKEKNKFTGSLKDSIDFSIHKAAKQFEDNIPDSMKSRKAKEEFKAGLRAVFNETMYFNKEDLKQSGAKPDGIRHWIDDKYNPADDDEFVEIYRRLQDMPKSQFDDLTKDLTDKQLGINDINGYDMLVKVKSANYGANAALRNTLFYDDYVKDIKISETKPNYKYNKLERATSGYIYTGERTFDDLYRSMNFSLSSLEYEKAFNKYRDENFRNYQAIPAYPKLKLDNDPAIDKKLETSAGYISKITDTISSYKNVKYDLNLVHGLDEYAKSIPSGRKLTPVERSTINKMAGDFITCNFSDTTIQDSLDAAFAVTSLDKNADISQYNKYIDVMVKEFNAVEKINDEETINSNIKTLAAELDMFLNMLCDYNIPPQYKHILKEDAQNLIKMRTNNIVNRNGLDGNKNILKLSDKISKYGIETDEKKKTDSFTRFTNAVDKAKTMKSSDKDIHAQLDKINKLADNYVDKYIDEEHKQQVRAAFSDYTSKEINGGNTRLYEIKDVINAQEKFNNDFRKYYITAYPVEILNNFLLYSASDAGDVEQKSAYKNYLTNELELSKFIDIQEALMNAVQTGNAAEVSKHFGDYYVKQDADDRIVSMNSDEAIDYMVRSLVMEDNTKTAKMFVEKLGLSDRVLDIESKALKSMKPEEKVKNIAKILSDTSTITGAVNTEITSLSAEIDNSDDYARKIDQCKKNIYDQTKGIKRKKILRLYYKALDKAKSLIRQNPGVSKSTVLNQYYEEAVTQAAELINKDIEDNRNYLDIVNLMYKFLSDLHLPEYSDGYKVQQGLKDDYKKLTEYTDAHIGALAGGKKADN